MIRSAVAILALVLPCAASAVPMIFQFTNYEDPPANDHYGLTLSNLPSDAPFGTSTDFSINNVTLTWDPDDLGAGATLQGTLTNNGVTNLVWDFVYNLTGLVASGNGFTSTDASGTLSRAGGPSYGLMDWRWSSPVNPITFLFLENGDGWSATGYLWRNKNLSKKPGKAFFYADASLVPLPAAVWLFGSALLALFGFKRFGRRGVRTA